MPYDREDEQMLTDTPYGSEPPNTMAETIAMNDGAPPDAPADTGADTPPADVQMEDAFAEREELLNALRAVPTEEGQPRGEDGRFIRKSDGTQMPGTDGKAPPQQQQQQQPSDDAEILSSLKPRAQERFKQMTETIKETTARATQLEADVSEFRELVTSTGLNAEEFAGMLHIGRLMKSGNESDLRIALEHIDALRADLYKQAGIEAPGVDPLSDFPDLRNAVENMELNKDYALQLAKVRRQEHAQQQMLQAQHASQQEMRHYQQAIAQAGQTAEAYFKTREHEADYPAKMAQIQARFKDPAFVNEFISTYEPRQWFGIFKLMYDNLVVAAPQKMSGSQPLRSRPTLSGMPQAAAGDHVGAMKSVLAQMGIGGNG